MKKNITLISKFLFAALVFFSSTICFGQIKTYSFTLNGANESPANASLATGTATVTVNVTNSTMRVQSTFTGLTGNASACHIHAATATANSGTAGVATQTPSFTGFPLGVTAGVYDYTYDMTLTSSYNASYVTANGGTTVTAFSALVAALDASKAYFNIHTSAFPGGEIRGFSAIPPTITCPGAITVCGVANVPAANIASVTATASCAGAITITHQGDVSTPSTTAPYVITRTYRATDFCGNFSDCTQSITVNPTPVVNAVGNQVVCNNENTSTVSFTGAVAGTTYTWTNSNTSIGLAASGTGNIPSFVATNTGTTPITGTISVTPSAGAALGSTVTQTFNYTGAVQTFTVPAGVTSINIDANGAEGASGSTGSPSTSVGGAGGKGAKVTGTLAVTPGQVINFYVGQAATGATGGFNGGGTGGNTTAGGGGGASDVRVGGTAFSNRVIVAAGGGGGGTGGFYYTGSPTFMPGGKGGNSSSNGANGTSSSAGGGGFGGAVGSGGAFGVGCNIATTFGTAGSNGTTGLGGAGGVGALCCGAIAPGGGGGGGGFVGGGGGGGGTAGTTGCTGNDKGAGGGGAGGSSYIGGVTTGSITDGVQSGNGVITISYTPTSPCTGTPVTYTYTVNPSPTTPTITTGGPTTFCTGGSVVLTSSTATDYYLWSTGETTQSITVTTGGNYTVTVGSGGCTSSLSAATNVTVSSTPTVSNAGPDINACISSGTATMAGNVPSVGTGAWTQVPGGPSIANIIVPSSATTNINGLTTAGVYKFVWTISNGSCTPSTDTMTIVVNPNPIPFIVSGGGLSCPSTTTLTGPSDPNYTYVWERSLSGIASPNSFTAYGGTAATQLVTLSGNYRLIVTNQFGCSTSDTASVAIADYVFNGSLGAGDAQQTGRMNRFAAVSSCASPKIFPGNFTTSGARYYDSYTITNPRSVPVCATIGIASNCGVNMFSAAYLSSFNPVSLGTNYLADPGSSFPNVGFYEASIPANGTIVVVVHEVNVGTGCTGYQLTVDVPRDLTAITATPSSVVFNGTSTVAAPVAGTYAWSPGSGTTQSITTAPITASGTKYYATLGYGNAGCTRLDSVVVNLSCTLPVLTCPTNTTVAACQSQAAVNTAFATWLATASGSGGTSGVLTNNNTGAPSACGGSTTVTFTYTNTCPPLVSTCQATFTVATAPTVVLTCPTNTTAAACQSQAAVNTAFATWLATASASGGCNGVLTNNNTGAPSACGGSTTVTFTYNSSCAPLTTTCQATFTVAAAPTVVLTCPTNTTAAACQSQAAVNTAFATWLASVSASGGCNGFLTNNNTGAPSACGGSTTVTFTYTSNCAPLTTTCQATFTVATAPTVVLTCPTNTTVASCQTQAAVNTAFATWLATATSSGGCNGIRTNNNTGAPSACGGSTTVTFTYTSTCSPLTTTCQATFTVSAPPVITMTCPGPVTVCGAANVPAPNPSSVTGVTGCTVVVTHVGDVSTPSTTSPYVITRTYRATDLCGNFVNCTQLITVNPTATVNAVVNQVVCNNSPTTAVNFTSPTTGGTIVYNWTNNTTSIGLAAAGSGNIPSFTATNTTTAPVTATITVTPSYTNAGLTCVGTPRTFTITVNPTATVTAVSNQVVCNNSPTTAVTFTSPTTGGTVVYNWTNNTTSIGLAASGVGNIASFNGTNTSNAPVTATITVTPSYTNAGVTCVGTPITYTYTVNPTPTVNVVANQTICNGASTTTVNFAGTVAGTVFSWTNNTTSIGLVASGTGNIASFTATNNTTAPVTATITVTPSTPGSGVIDIGSPYNMVPYGGNVGIIYKATLTGTNTGGSIWGTNTYTHDSYLAMAAVHAGVLTVGQTGVVYIEMLNGLSNYTSTLQNGITSSAWGSWCCSYRFVNAPTSSTPTCTGSPRTFTITVNPTATVNPIANQVLCNNFATTAVNFSSPATGGTIVYNWTNSAPSIGLAATGTGNIPTFTATNTTQVPVVATISTTASFTNGGVTCTGPAQTFTITVNPTPIVTLAAFAPICKNAPAITLTGGLPLVTAGTTGVYTVDNVTQTVFNPANYAPGLHTIVYTYTNIYGCVNSATQTILLHPIHTVEITLAPNTGLSPGSPVTAIATVSPVDNYTYAWSKNNASIITSPTNTDRILIQANDAGNYKVTVTAPTGCVVTSANIFTPSNVVPTTLFVFPNPSTGLFNVSYNNGGSNLTARTLNVYDALGQKIYSKRYDVNVPFGNMQVDLRNKAAGMYTIELLNNNGKQLGLNRVIKN